MADEDDEKAKTVPYERFAAVNTRMKEAETGRREAETKLAAAEAKGGSVADLQTKLTATEATLAAERATWATERPLLAAGIKDELDQATVLLVHGRIAKDKPLGAWLDGLAKDPSKAPRPIAHLFAAPTDEVIDETDTAEGDDVADQVDDEPEPKPKPKGGPGPKPSSGKGALRSGGQPAPTPAELAAARAKIPTDGGAEYRALRARIPNLRPLPSTAKTTPAK